MSTFYPSKKKVVSLSPFLPLFKQERPPYWTCGGTAGAAAALPEEAYKINPGLHFDNLHHIACFNKTKQKGRRNGGHSQSRHLDGGKSAAEDDESRKNVARCHSYWRS